jgi:Domain of unknown function (DUF1772)
MKGKLLATTYLAALFVTTIYVGLMWSLHFFWFPSWQEVASTDFRNHFEVPVREATRFFTYLVPIQLLSLGILAWIEFRGRFRWLTLSSFIIMSATHVLAIILIFPINRKLSAVGTPELEVRSGLQQWMMYNDGRGFLATTVWFLLLVYILKKGDLVKKFEDGSA